MRQVSMACGAVLGRRRNTHLAYIETSSNYGDVEGECAFA